MRWLRLGVVGLLLLAFGALAPVAQAAPQTHPVSIMNIGYHPASLTVSMGDSVKWSNDETPTTGPSHTVHSDEHPELNSPTLVPGNTYTFTFDAPGTYPYYCTIHGKNAMSGTIIVNPPAATSTTHLLGTTTTRATTTTVKRTTTSSHQTTTIDTSPTTTETLALDTTTSEDTTSTTAKPLTIKTKGKGTSTGAVVGLVVAIAAVLGAGGYALYRLRANTGGF